MKISSTLFTRSATKWHSSFPYDDKCTEIMLLYLGIWGHYKDYYALWILRQIISLAPSGWSIFFYHFSTNNIKWKYFSNLIKGILKLNNLNITINNIKWRKIKECVLPKLHLYMTLLTEESYDTRYTASSNTKVH